MKKILEGFCYGILTAVICIVACLCFLGSMRCVFWIFGTQPWRICCLFIVGIIGFFIGVGAYLDKLEREGKND